MSWYRRSMRGGDTHQGTVRRGRVATVCGLGFPAAGTRLPGKPADPAQVCYDCDSVAQACVTGKRGYATEAEARGALLSTRVNAALNPGSARRERRCYSCAQCGCWHLTSSRGGGGR